MLLSQVYRSLLFPVSPASQDTRGRAQTSPPLLSSGCSMVVVKPTACNIPMRRGQAHYGRKWQMSWKQVMQELGLCHMQMTWTASWHCWLSWWTSDRSLLPSGHTSPSLPWTCTSKKLTARSASWSSFCFVQGFICFLFWLCFLMIKATFDMSAALKDTHPLLLVAPLSHPASVHPCPFLLHFTSSYLTTVSLFSKSLLALCQHPFSVGSPKVQLSAACSFSSFFLCYFHFNTNY